MYFTWKGVRLHKRPAQSREKKAAAAARRKVAQRAAVDATSNSSVSPSITPELYLTTPAISYDAENWEISLVTDFGQSLVWLLYGYKLVHIAPFRHLRYCS
jgi:hypothetical protein